MKKKIKTTNIFAISIIIIIIISILLYKHVNVDILKNYISNNPLIYILSFIILPIFFFPVPILAIASGMIFGVFNGSLYTIIAAMINSAIMYYISRFLSSGFRDFIKSKLNKKNIIQSMMNKNNDNLFIVFLILRFVPLISYNFINYMAGMTEIRLLPYLLSTLIGILPGTIILINVGDKIYDVKSSEFIISIALTILLILISLIILKIYKRRLHGDNNNTNIQ